MKKTVITLATAASLTLTMGAGASAENVEVKKGDTLWGLSKEYGTSVEDLLRWNNLNSDLIFPNQQLRVSSTENYTVESGDTLWGIAKYYGVSVDGLMNTNSLNSDIIHPGQNLVIDLDNRGVATLVNKQEQASSPEQAPAEESKTEPAAQETAAAEPAEVQETVPAQPAETPVNTQPTQEEANAITVSATAYTADCIGCSGVTKTGVDLNANPDAKVIAVDPNVIPLGTEVYVEGYGYATAQDIGGAIKGNKIDVFIPERQDALDWGVRSVKVTILD
ncbi:LysM peptidoglycan-binding domain-containing protein [Rossellomorea vietnamensis]|uniref:LysM peptidoglycan-binding domain-containing protein n=1 Tax=Rossellomorea vietnamensis TaxID=218284 RepID=A0A5D4MFH5_9BACI|nr:MULTISPECIES: 3D domain-containing protein [Bacillaceae]TYS00412.1 LysM peptidoglycan-binding domain-containing protein [Rossellomorea vietnamensis]